MVRLADAKPVQLGHAFKADGRWRVLAFAPAGDAGQAGGAVAQLCAALAPVIAGFTPKGADPDSVIDLRAVFQIPHREMRLEELPARCCRRRANTDSLTMRRSFARRKMAPISSIFAASTGRVGRC